MSYVSDGLLTFRKHAKKSLPDLRWQWRFELLDAEPADSYVMLEEIDRSVNKSEELRSVGADGEMEFYEHVTSLVRVMVVSDSAQKSMGMAHSVRRHMRRQSFMLMADCDGIAVGPPGSIQSVQLPDYRSGQTGFKSVAMTTVRVSYVEVYRDNLGVIKEVDFKL